MLRSKSQDDDSGGNDIRQKSLSIDRKGVRERQCVAKLLWTSRSEIACWFW